MLSADLTVVDNHSSLTLPGNLGSKVYAGVATVVPGQSKRRIAATANSTPQEITVGHQLTGGSGFRGRIRSVVRHDYRDLSANLSSTDSVVPSCSAQFVLDRPQQSAGYITDAIIQNSVGACLDVLLTSGALAKIMNQES